jgi:hypothetical protein
MIPTINNPGLFHFIIFRGRFNGAYARHFNIFQCRQEENLHLIICGPGEDPCLPAGRELASNV